MSRTRRTLLAAVSGLSLSLFLLARPAEAQFDVGRLVEGLVNEAASGNFRIPSHGGGYGGGYGGGQNCPPTVYPRPVYPQPQPVQPVVPVSKFERAKQAFLARNYTEALKFAEAAAQEDPENHDILQFGSQVLMAQGRYREAATAAHKALQMGPGWSWNTLWKLYGSKEHYVQHYEALKTATTNNPESVDLNFLLAYHYLMLGHLEQGRARLQTVVKLAPGEPVSTKLLAMLPAPEQSSVASN